jgi:hypothetical protein
MAWPFDKTHKVAETSFSKFIRGASSGDKKRVYQRVLKNATDRQVRLIEEVRRVKDVRHAEASSSKK